MSTTLGMTATIGFAAFGNKQIEGKVDTGATVSSLHAENIKMGRGQVSFTCSKLSSNSITLPLEGSQEVHSADAGGVERPIVKLDVEVNGVALQGMTFNLNDRSGMDSAVLIGQNILKAGDFTIDPNGGGSDTEASQPQTQTPALAGSDLRDSHVLQALNVLAESNVTLAELVTYLQTLAVNRIKD